MLPLTSSPPRCAPHTGCVCFVLFLFCVVLCRLWVEGGDLAGVEAARSDVKAVEEEEEGVAEHVRRRQERGAASDGDG